MQDVQDAYSLDMREIERQLGRKCIEAFNPGIALVPAKTVDFNRFELHLQHPGFWNPDGSGHYFAELTLWAMELSLANAHPLPRAYAIAPKVPGVNGFVCCHYCGGITPNYLFYTDGIPKIKADFQKAGIFELAS
jgi:hypothetical protein